MSRYIGNDPVFFFFFLETRQWRLHQGNEVQPIVVRHSELNQQIGDKKANHFLGLDQFLEFYSILASSKVIWRTLYYS